MTVLNAFVSPSRALVIMDTRGVSARDGNSSPNSKMFPIVHASAVIAVAGDTDFGPALMGKLYWRSFDAMWDGVIEGGLMRDAARQVRWWSFLAGSRVLDVQHILLVGYSQRDRCIRGLVALRETRGKPFRIVELAGQSPVMITPARPEFSNPYGPGSRGGNPDTAAKMIELARFQIDQVHQKLPQYSAAFGPPLTLATITASAVNISIVQ